MTRVVCGSSSINEDLRLRACHVNRHRHAKTAQEVRVSDVVRVSLRHEDLQRLAVMVDSNRGEPWGLDERGGNELGLNLKKNEAKS